ncbi:MAG: NAD(P)H-hydrate epimerase [Thaumarchaeota archaeon]|nr:NAD(P)H-hydrate epimerase [Nitrososphaerota archaeon]
MKFQDGLAFLTAGEMAEADRFAIDTLGTGVDSLMENAGVKTAEMALRLLGGDVAGKKIEILVGKGNNGGDGLVAARHIHNWGGDVTVILGDGSAALRDSAAKQFATVEKMGVREKAPDEELEGELIVDALLGYGARGSPREPLAGLIRRATASKLPILAVDVPSGLDATTGEPGEPCVTARATVTFGFPKTGFLDARAKGHLGDLYVADISLPKTIYEKYSCPGVFSRRGLIRVW